MKVAVVGLWHLGCVTAACLVKGGHDVLAFDSNTAVIDELKNKRSPIFEPGLDELLNQGYASGKLTYSADHQDLGESDIIWVTFDTPVNDHDVADVNYVLQEVKQLFAHAKTGALFLISSQIPVGSTQKLQALCTESYPEKNITFAYSPENLRLGKAIDVFSNPDRVVVGVEMEKDKARIQTLLQPFTQHIIWMSIVSAEMTKHAINAFLAVSVTFINELSTLCESVGANAREVELGLKSEERIGPKAYLRPGDAIAGGTLMRDIQYLTELGQQKDRHTFLLSAILSSNQYHKQWSCRKLSDLLKDLKNKKIAMLGLTYKAGTDTLRRSTVLETCKWLSDQGSQIFAYDPVVNDLPEEYAQFIHIKATPQEALQLADAVVVSTEWPQFRNLTADEFVTNLKQPFVLDPSGFIAKNIGQDERLKYYSVGMPT